MYRIKNTCQEGKKFATGQLPSILPARRQGSKLAWSYKSLQVQLTSSQLVMPAKFSAILLLARKDLPTPGIVRTTSIKHAARLVAALRPPWICFPSLLMDYMDLIPSAMAPYIYRTGSVSGFIYFLDTEIRKRQHTVIYTEAYFFLNPGWT